MLSSWNTVIIIIIIIIIIAKYRYYTVEAVNHNQTARMRGLICAFVVPVCHNLYTLLKYNLVGN